jgi:hypothetical protein
MGLIEEVIKCFICGLTNQGYLTLERKQLALDMLNIILWLDGEDVEVTGVMEPEKQVYNQSNFAQHVEGLVKSG